jgi:hypothetical protein
MAWATSAKRKGALFLGHARMEHHLEQQIAEFVAQRRHVTGHAGLRHLIGFLDRVRRDRGEILLDVPWAALLRIAQPRHDRDQPIHRRGMVGRRETVAFRGGRLVGQITLRIAHLSSR